MARKLVLQNNPLFSGSAYADRDPAETEPQEKESGPYREIPLSSLDRDLNLPYSSPNEGPSPNPW